MKPDRDHHDVLAGLMAQMLDQLEEIAAELAGAPVRFAPIRARDSGDNTIIGPSSGGVVGRLQVVSYVLVAKTAVDVLWKAGGREISGTLGLGATSAVSARGTRREPLLETDPGEELLLNLSAAVTVGGHLAYVEALRRE